MEGSNQRVRVALRVRPLCKSEEEKGSVSFVNIRQNSVVCNTTSRHNLFNFDWAFGPKASQQDVYQDISASIKDQLFEGINATILACKRLRVLETFVMVGRWSNWKRKNAYYWRWMFKRCRNWYYAKARA